jgi:excisionase family DNA binding protein
MLSAQHRASQSEEGSMNFNSGPKAAYAIADICEQLSLGRTTVFAEIKKGNLKIVKVGRRSLVTAEELARYMQRLSSAQS